MPRRAGPDARLSWAGRKNVRHCRARKESVMKATHSTSVEKGMSRTRYTELKQMLDERRREIQAEVQGRMRGVREEGTWGKLNEVVDAVESAEADIQEEIEFALVQ